MEVLVAVFLICVTYLGDRCLERWHAEKFKLSTDAFSERLEDLVDTVEALEKRTKDAFDPAEFKKLQDEVAKLQFKVGMKA